MVRFGLESLHAEEKQSYQDIYILSLYHQIPDSELQSEQTNSNVAESGHNCSVLVGQSELLCITSIFIERGFRLDEYFMSTKG